jgi:hypothetical protein
MEKFAPFLPFAVFAVVIGYMVFRYFRFGSFVGMSVGARVVRKLGTVETVRNMGTKRVLTVYLLERELGGPVTVAMGETAKTFGGWAYTAMKLPAEQARELARLLELAAKG